MTSTPSSAHRASRRLLCFEMFALVLPVGMVAMALGLLFVAFAVPGLLIGTIAEPSPIRVLGAATVIPTGFLMLVGMGAVAHFGTRYVTTGRTTFVAWRTRNGLVLWSAPVIALLWIVAALSQPPSELEGLVRTMAVLVSPGLVLLFPALHLSLAKSIADWHVRQGDPIA